MKLQESWFNFILARGGKQIIVLIPSFLPRLLFLATGNHHGNLLTPPPPNIKLLQSLHLWNCLCKVLYSTPPLCLELHSVIYWWRGGGGEGRGKRRRCNDFAVFHFLCSIPELFLSFLPSSLFLPLCVCLFTFSPLCPRTIHASSCSCPPPFKVI